MRAEREHITSPVSDSDPELFGKKVPVEDISYKKFVRPNRTSQPKPGVRKPFQPDNNYKNLTAEEIKYGIKMQEENVKNNMESEHWRKIESIVKHDEKLLGKR